MWMLGQLCACASSEGDRGVSSSAMILNCSQLKGGCQDGGRVTPLFHLRCYDWLVGSVISPSQRIAVVFVCVCELS